MISNKVRFWAHFKRLADFQGREDRASFWPYAAAVARRLHDRGMSGWWGLMPVPFLAYSCIQMPRFFGAGENGNQPDLTIFFSIFVSNLIYMITLIALIVLLAGAGQPEQDRLNDH